MILDDRRPVTLLICALGGEGGGVLAEWLVETATRCGYARKAPRSRVSRSAPATTYYFEVFPVPVAELGGRKPVFSLYPVPGALDVLVSSELLETVRHIGNGMTSANRTLVVTSSSRTLTTAEKLQLADGRAPSEELLEVVRQYSQSARIFDMSAVAQETGTVLSAVLFGAIAGSGALPFSRECVPTNHPPIGKRHRAEPARIRARIRDCGRGTCGANASPCRAADGRRIAGRSRPCFPAAHPCDAGRRPRAHAGVSGSRVRRSLRTAHEAGSRSRTDG
jgi:Pyruvate/2-oxoacid:ferredoxin oxidoreductase gamma subunit